jgi:hypothetical protein
MSMAFHYFAEESQRNLAITTLCEKAFQDFPHVAHSPPKAVRTRSALGPRISAANSRPNCSTEIETTSWLMSHLRSRK